MRSGLWVLNIMALVWCAAGIIVGHQPVWLVVIPAAISVALLLWASRQSVDSGNPVEGNHFGRIVGIATAIEGVAIFVVANVLVNMHVPDAIMPAIAVIVGLHFVPLARWIPVRPYYWTGGALVVVGLAALLLPAPDRAIATGIGAALTLWASGIMLVRYGRG